MAPRSLDSSHKNRVKRGAESLNKAFRQKGILKKRQKIVLSQEELQNCFRRDLYSPGTLKISVDDYASSSPYKHGVITCLIDDNLLRSVRNEILGNIHFTIKETDIYKIYQSGDLANLDGLDDGALEKLPSLLRLRNALYSPDFRKYISTITGCGDLSERKTDMAINVYTPGCYLLCHDDVIGSRRVSYILYLTDPDTPWKEEWGGALRLFPTVVNDENGVKIITPCPDVEKSIPPMWNQLSFFAVRPGESFHEVEEVYHATTAKQLKKDGGRVRMAISGWFHIPQQGEEGYIEHEEKNWGKNSSLKQLQGNPDRYDFPKEHPSIVKTLSDEEKAERLSESDLDFLLKYIAPNYLTPDTLDSIAKKFLNLSCVTLDTLLSQQFSSRVKEFIEAEEEFSVSSNHSRNKNHPYKVARPPHKHRFLYLQPELPPLQETRKESENPFSELLTSLLPSKPFRKWLELATDCTIESFNVLGRRFRRGSDYSLATKYDGKPRLEISLGLTTSSGWGEDEEDKEAFDSKDIHDLPKNSFSASVDGHGSTHVSRDTKKKTLNESYPPDDFGGQEVYMIGDDSTEDAAIYKGNQAVEDENILFTIPASWNQMSIVLRDRGVLKFMKYVSKNAKSDRWDVRGIYDVTEDGDTEEEEQDSDTSETSFGNNTVIQEEGSDEEFTGFPD